MSKWHGVQLRISGSSDDLFDWIRFHSHLMDLWPWRRGRVLATQAWQHFFSCWTLISAAGFDCRETTQIKVTNVEKIMDEAMESWMNIGKKGQNIHHRQFVEDQQKNFIRQIEQMTTIRHFSDSDSLPSHRKDIYIFVHSHWHCRPSAQWEETKMIGHKLVWTKIGWPMRWVSAMRTVGLVGWNGKDSPCIARPLSPSRLRLVDQLHEHIRDSSSTRSSWKYKKLVFIFLCNYSMKKKKKKKRSKCFFFPTPPSISVPNEKTRSKTISIVALSDW